MLDIIGSVVAILVGVTVLLGAAIRYALVPYLRDQIKGPLDEINKQVSVNGGTSKPPTLVDRVEAGNKIADEARGLAREAIEEIGALSRMFDGHLEWSQKEVDRMWDAIRERKRR